MWDRGQEVTSIGGLWRNQNLFSRPLLHNLARLHDDDSIAQQTHDVEVVGDEEVTHSQRILEVLQKIENHRLHRYVERGRRLVENDEIGLERDGASNPDTRFLSAGK